MPALPLLEHACKPRPSVFDPTVRDTVYNIDELRSLDPGAFFRENWVTEGMRILLTEAFKRLEGKIAGASGVFQLSQSMGGGKTHNLLALGLLALHPAYRMPVMQGFYDPGPLGAVPVVTFSGRKTNTPFGIWGEIAGQLNKKDAFKDFYSPLAPPGEDDWVELLRGGPALILLDELPPYFEAARARAVGNTYLDAITTTALSNLLVAVNSGKLPATCVLITDLSGAAYAAGSASVNAALDDLAKETNRGAVTIDPVKLSSNELYHILRTRLFEVTPPRETVDAVAAAYAEALGSARKMDITTASPEQLQAEIAESYPFHPAIRELYARFKENKNFQQTRALIRIMRVVVAHLWSTGAGTDKLLIGAHDYDLHQQEILSEIRQINAALTPAIDHDIARETRTSVAEEIDADGPPTAQDAARLIFLASLSQAVNPVLGLDRSEIARDLAAPGRDLADLNSRIDELRRGWYLHTLRDGKLLYRDIQNLRAKLDTYVQGKLREQRKAELRKRLQELFKPEVRDVCQRVEAMPALDEVQLAQDEVTLVIFEPSSDGRREIDEFYEHQQLRNRVLFLTGPEQPYESILQRAAELSAINTIIDELKTSKVMTADAQLVEAEEIKGRVEGQFYQAVVSTFQTLLYPVKSGLNETQLGGAYVANSFKGEAQVKRALAEAYKFTEKIGADDPFRASLENKLWPESVKQMLWSEIRRRAATDPSWMWHHPGALESLKAELIKRDQWRDIGGGYVERGPFPRPPAGVTVQQLFRDADTGEATLRIRPLHADTVYWSASGPATTGSQRLEDVNAFKTAAARVWFLAVDSTAEHESTDPEVWRATLTVKYRIYQDGDRRCCELQALPAGAIRYTTDGSGPEAHGVPYTEPFTIPDGCRLILAVAQDGDIKSDLLTVSVPATTGGDGAKPAVLVDTARPATWQRRHQKDDTNAAYTWLQTVVKSNAELGGLALVVSEGSDNWIELRTGGPVYLPAARAMEEADRLKALLPAGNISLEVEALRFPNGRDLSDLVRDLKDELKPGEVKQ